MRRDLVVVGGSAGGVEALQRFAAGLPEDLPAAIVVVLHMPSGISSRLAPILDRSGSLPADDALDNEPLVPGTIRVARPDHHLLVMDGRLRLSSGPPENFHRPAIDTLFRSAARARGQRTIGMLLSGVLDDGVDGLREIRTRGGTAVVQDPNDALFAQLPELALRAMPVEHTIRAADAGPLLARLTRQEIDHEGDGNRPPSEGSANLHSGLICPECGGGLDQLGSGHQLHFRCRVGHAFGPETLLASQEQDAERALWAAARLMEDRATLLAKMEARADERGARDVGKRYRRQASEAARHAWILKDLATGEAGEGSAVPGGTQTAD